MEFFLVSILTTVGGIILYAIIGAVVKAPGNVLAVKFRSLGDMSGKTYTEIKNVVGVENSISTTTNDAGETIKIRQWISTGYHITLLFDSNDNFICISSETKVWLMLKNIASITY